MPGRRQVIATGYTAARISHPITRRTAMASLVFCSGCNRQVDPAAAACPHCGLKRTPGVAGSSSGSTTAIIIIVCVIGVVFLIGILAAIALPAYQDYTVRARISETLIAASEAKHAVASYVADKHELPTS